MSWRHRFKFKDLLTHEDVDDKTAQGLAVQAASRVRNSRVFGESARVVLLEHFEGVDNQESFNCALEVLYNVADTKRVWIE